MVFSDGVTEKSLIKRLFMKEEIGLEEIRRDDAVPHGQKRKARRNKVDHFSSYPLSNFVWATDFFGALSRSPENYGYE